MPHFIVEYSANLEHELDLDRLFANVHRQLIAMQQFPTGGIRSRARRIEHYCFADGLGDYAGVHVELKLSATRPQAVREEIGQRIFATLEAHFADLQARRFLALSMEVGLFHPGSFFNSNNLHALFEHP
ncbi:5-carboxymethyl-2-hydroxymuconate Delta-isomerase [compost metagenome]|jgi:5-carboxymethyl-2-hydroxymuconate isomerase|uniref:5-carboxymethyl-2-hydroxymuconate isomerase n=1 Tax=Pseudomonas TaxID=286 RepID=UPI000F91AB4D|nr:MULTISPECIES: 5-carboxymethyl-2-hydroxymuconate isomerase [Pseudomonas]WPN32201.1 5-carboxymethyl-2-hydroxymuconate isomerase [Pseudomonas sp. P5_109]VVP20107.1 5-carboxymethyl-2-hydroxymuconate Delta-isomerase [Pseudomonas fluorescens]